MFPTMSRGQVAPIRGEWVQVVIEDLYPGMREPDVAISELRVISQPAR